MLGILAYPKVLFFLCQISCNYGMACRYRGTPNPGGSHVATEDSQLNPVRSKGSNMIDGGRSCQGSLRLEPIIEKGRTQGRSFLTQELQVSITFMIRKLLLNWH